MNKKCNCCFPSKQRGIVFSAKATIYFSEFFLLIQKPDQGPGSKALNRQILFDFDGLNGKLEVFMGGKFKFVVRFTI